MVSGSARILGFGLRRVLLACLVKKGGPIFGRDGMSLVNIYHEVGYITHETHGESLRNEFWMTSMWISWKVWPKKSHFWDIFITISSILEVPNFDHSQNRMWKKSGSQQPTNDADFFEGLRLHLKIHHELTTVVDTWWTLSEIYGIHNYFPHQLPMHSPSGLCIQTSCCWNRSAWINGKSWRFAKPFRVWLAEGQQLSRAQKSRNLGHVLVLTWIALQ